MVNISVSIIFIVNSKCNMKAGKQTFFQIRVFSYICLTNKNIISDSLFQKYYCLGWGHGFLFFSFIFISWRLITLQYCSGFCHTLTWISHGFTCIPHTDPPSHLPLHLDSFGSSQCTSPEYLSHASNLDWPSVSYLIIHMFQCYSLRSSHPRLLP